MDQPLTRSSDRQSLAQGFERQFLGAVRDGIPSNGAPLRLPIIAVKAPAVLATSARMMRRMEPEYQAWWEQRTSAPTASTGMLNEALRRADADPDVRDRIHHRARDERRRMHAPHRREHEREEDQGDRPGYVQQHVSAARGGELGRRLERAYRRRRRRRLDLQFDLRVEPW